MDEKKSERSLKNVQILRLPLNSFEEEKALLSSTIFLFYSDSSNRTPRLVLAVVTTKKDSNDVLSVNSLTVSSATDAKSDAVGE